MSVVFGPVRKMLAGIDGVVIEPMDLMSAPSIEQGAPTSVWSAGSPLLGGPGRPRPVR
jgi:hypothetical protein